MAKVIRTVAEVKTYVRRQKHARKSIGLVPTMGALHEGHLSLVRRSVKENDRTVVSVFVNPTQFAPGEDLDKYPRQLEDDVKACTGAKAHVVFAPSAEEVYPEGFQTFVEVEGLTTGLCGRSRPGHFRGVATVCAKLFGMVEPDRAYFGRKDYQQLAVIRRMVRDLDMTVEIVGCPIVREPDGLAMSSRNVYLDVDLRERAPALYRALLEAKRLVEREGVTAAVNVKRAVRGVVRRTRIARIDYVEIVHPETLEPIDVIEGPAVVALAVYFDKTRLIDNITVNAEGAD